MLFIACHHRLSGGIGKFDRRTLLKNLIGGFCRAEPSETGILSLANGIVQVELNSEVPLAVVGVLTIDVVCVECEERLIWGHMGRPRIEKLHGEIELIGVGR